MNKHIAMTLILSLAFSAWADDETAAAIEEVQRQMQSPAFHQNAAKNSPEAKNVQSHVKDLTGNPENEQALYQLAAEVLGNLKNKSPEELDRYLQEIQKDPEAFARSWTPEQKRKLKELSERLPAAKGKKP